MRVRSHHLAVSLFAGAIFLSGLAWVSIRVPTVQAACGTGAGITIAGPPTTGGSIGGTVPLMASTTSVTGLTTVTFALSTPTTMVLGNGLPQTTGSTANWVFNWDTTTVLDGSYQLMAIAHYGSNTAADCSSQLTSINVHNGVIITKAPTLLVTVVPGIWQALPGQQRNFSVSGTYTNQNGTQYPLGTALAGATYAWDTSTGSTTPTGGPSTTLTAGPRAGTYALGVTVTMNGVAQHAVATINITAPTSTSASGATPTPTPSPSPTITTTVPPTPVPIAGIAGTAPLTAAQITTLTTTPTIFRPTSDTNAAPILPAPILGCLQAKIGTDYSAISSGLLQPSVTDRLNGLACFSGANRIPSILAPVAPTHIDEVPQTNSLVTIGTVLNQTITNKTGDKLTAILINGTGVPNSDIYLYVFSDPMVLRAETDAQGKWSYVLQNPLKPGKHEVYAVAAKDSTNFVRTSAIPISIAVAANGNKDGSLVIESRWQAAQVGYVGVAILMIIAALLLLIRLVRRPRVITGTLPELVMPDSPGKS